VVVKWHVSGGASCVTATRRDIGSGAPPRYWRSFSASVSCRSGLALVSVPVLNALFFSLHYRGSGSVGRPVPPSPGAETTDRLLNHSITRGSVP